MIHKLHQMIYKLHQMIYKLHTRTDPGPSIRHWWLVHLARTRQNCWDYNWATGPKWLIIPISSFSQFTIITHTHTHTHTHIHTHTHTHTHTHARTHTRTHARTHARTHTHSLSLSLSENETEPQTAYPVTWSLRPWWRPSPWWCPVGRWRSHGHSGLLGQCWSLPSCTATSARRWRPALPLWCGSGQGQSQAGMEIQTQKGSNARLFILTRTHSMQIFGEIPFIKPQKRHLNNR